MFDALLLGLGIGFLAVLAPGPISLAIVEIGAQHGRRRSVLAGLGVAGGDLGACAAALALLAAGRHLPSSVLDGAAIVSTTVLAVIGLGLILRPEVGRSAVRQLRRPFRTMLAVTTLNPAVFGSWLAVLAALPMTDDLARLAAVGGGGVAASLIWHLGLGTGAAAVCEWLTDRRLTTLARSGGIGMVGLAVGATVI